MWYSRTYKYYMDTTTNTNNRNATEVAMTVDISKLTARPNNPQTPGKQASRKVAFGPRHRFAIAAVHSRFDSVDWFVWDAEVWSSETDGPAIIRQSLTPARALDGLDHERWRTDSPSFA